ncbi:sigma 54-interacting transcriptional regulator [Polyangium fumosum]|uniref:Sigma-54-dependent Fis family transcriptional regulator n=1 Tax=Polyangium fumosum TaxID=889272 RepID=A0A4U1JAC2_9BACT|nr:sigma 54-interacting transcriptional regulator [Polyangium fumosum]TKD05192.1 sigma-54-dependent Fis family transcriptional regulator [Polyangium fumosum]
MSSQDAELSTLDGLSPPTHADDPEAGFASAHVPTLTIVWHPTLERVGDRALLPLRPNGSSVLVSRLEPDFSRPGSSKREPLADPHVSRTPIRLLWLENECIRIEKQGSPTRVVVNGAPLESSRDFSANELQAGIVLELANRVVLLLHLDEARQESEDTLGLVGASLAIERVRREIRQLASLDVPVLVRGETGTGKELVARALHDTGTRRNRPFVPVNMGAIPPTLAASALFGADKGAFTGAVRSHGYFGSAANGTLFLDEVGEMPLDVQANLLRALDDGGEVQTLGASHMREMQARIVAATDADLEAKVQAGAFRAPLLHRLASYELVIPPLRQRRDDIGRLFVHFLYAELDRFGKADRIAANKVWLPASFLAALVRHEWPGNIRQLRNVVRQLVLGSHDAGPLDPGPALAALLATPPPPAVGNTSPGGEPGPPPTKAPISPRRTSRKPSDVTKDELLEALRTCDFDMKAAAERLRIPRSSIYNLVEQHKVRRASDLTREEILRCLRECDGNVELTARNLGVSKVALQRRMRELKIG